MAHEPVSLEELGVPQPIPSFNQWVRNLCARYETPDWNEYFLDRHGLTKKLQDELVPLAFLCQRLAAGRPNSYLKYFPTSDQSFDAHVLANDYSLQEVLEVTLACDGHRDSLVNEHLKKYGWAPLWTDLPYSGKRNSRQLPKPEMQSIDTEKIVEDGLSLIRAAIEKKSASGKYKDVSLVVGIDDFRFLPHHFEYVKAELEKIQSTFNIVYYVGLTEKFFYVQRRQLLSRAQ